MSIDAARVRLALRLNLLSRLVAAIIRFLSIQCHHSLIPTSSLQYPTDSHLVTRPQDGLKIVTEHQAMQSSVAYSDAQLREPTIISKSANPTHCGGKGGKPPEGPKNPEVLRKQSWGEG